MAHARSTRFGISAGALVLFATTSACSQAAETEADGAPGEPSSVEESKRVGFAQANFGNGWYEVQAEGVEAGMEELGHELTVVSGQGSPQTQNSQISTFITQQVDGLVLNPTDPLAVGSSVRALTDAGIPFVLVNTSLDESLADAAYCYVAEDEVENARQIGIEMARVLLEKHGEGATIKALMVKGFPGDSNSTRRDTGFKEGYASVDGAPELDLLPDVFGEFNADGAISAVRSIATANPDLQAIFTVTDSMLPGIETALKGAGLWDQVTIGGYDARMSVVKQMMDDPEGPIVATVANRPYEQGRIGAEMLESAMAGVPKEEACPGGSYFIEPALVTPENAAEYYEAEVPY
ncbi:sugar ABC transporter substrate-binding protein [Cellulomonas fimi]|uniref:Sugar ABC transporter substrate-binding protein n=1 Tax=Cellulomonas fimi TaxID=1708 RepID=A0A7Y0M0Q4_CELFI|nr:sugar ABC transporter substrate-binding protein [Cellulomonas fimi]NMR21698.1 sugar ABC transporter substrate-binding protein [Cellulomonas fimi]